MNVHQNNSFSGETVDLDNSAFRECSFENCALRFSATGPTELSGCRFEGSRLVPSGAAQLTLTYLRGFYHGLGDWGRSTVEAMVEAVRQGDSGAVAPGETPASANSGSPDPSAAYRAALEAFGASAEGHAIVVGFEHLTPERRRQIAELIGLAARKAA
jgi:hypothetical protein